MEAVTLPTEIAEEPKEDAQLSQGEDGSQPMDIRKKSITFAEATQSTENTCSQNSSTYKDALSQPAPGVSHKERLQWLQKRRSAGLWAQCDECNRWRYLPDVLDAHELPEKWFCRMNPDKTAADCTAPERPLRVREEEDLIHGEYAAGSLVWARLAGWPWWPAMVDDNPDTEQYYWLDGFSDIPTHYNVTWFDGNEVTRSWISPENLKPFGPYRYTYGKITNRSKDKKRLEVAITQVEDAESLTLDKRLAKYSFIARYPGAINHPKKVTRKEAERFQKRLQRKYNIAFPDESESSEDEIIVPRPRRQNSSTTVIQKGRNVLLVGSPKKPRAKKTKVNNRSKENARLQDSLLAPEQTATEQNTESAKGVFKEPNSLTAQLGSTVTSTVIDTDTTTYVPETKSAEIETVCDSEDHFQFRSTSSPKSDDFDF